MTEKADSKNIGQQGEEAAAQYLKEQRLEVVERHFQTRWGEIDLICRDRETWVFVEVKTRTHQSQPSATEVITPAKQKRMIGAALSFMKKKRLTNQVMRFDVIAIEAQKIEWIPGAFEASASYTF